MNTSTFGRAKPFQNRMGKEGSFEGERLLRRWQPE